MRNVRAVIVYAVLGILAGCSTSRPPLLDPEIKELADGANAAYHRGDVERADALYSKALQRARLSDNRDEISRNAYNLALCRMMNGKLSEARGLLDQAGASACVKSLASVNILLAQSEVARLSGKAAESEQFARQALEGGADREGRIHALLLQGEAAFVSGQTQAALAHYRASRSNVTGKTPDLISARLDGLAAHLIQAQMLEGDVGAIQRDRAEWLKKAGQFKDMVDALSLAAADFEQDGKYSEAFDCRIRAAQSLFAAGNRDAAREEAARAATLAEKTGNANHKVLAAGIMGDLK